MFDKYYRLQELQELKKNKRSLSYLNKLYRKAKKRNLKILSKRSILWEEIVEKIPANKRGEKIIYYKEDGKIYYYNFRLSTQTNTWCYSEGEVSFDDGNLKSMRDKKLTFLLSSNELSFEMGQKFRSLNLKISHLHSIVFKYLNDKVNKSLNEIFENNYFVSKILTISIDDSKYYVKNDNNNYYYHNFKIIGEVNESNTINLD